MLGAEEKLSEAQRPTEAGPFVIGLNSLTSSRFLRVLRSCWAIVDSEFRLLGFPFSTRN